MIRIVLVVVWREGSNFCSVFPSDQTFIFKTNILLIKWKYSEFEGASEEWSPVLLT